jgi:hypothetical protein
MNDLFYWSFWFQDPGFEFQYISMANKLKYFKNWSSDILSIEFPVQYLHWFKRKPNIMKIALQSILCVLKFCARSINSTGNVFLVPHLPFATFAPPYRPLRETLETKN